MKYTITLTILLLVFIGVYVNQSKLPINTVNVDAFQISDSTEIKIDSNKFYFPLETFRDDSFYAGHDTFTIAWYSKHLSAMKEQIIFTDKSEKEIYRFTWLRTFNNPIAIRIERTDNKYLLFWKLCDGKGGYDPGKLTINQEKKISEAEWKEFKNRINQVDFWNMKTNSKILGFDGAEWILEGKLNNQYHVVNRWSPKPSDNFYRCCDYLISLTELKIGDEEKY
jgi:hypothetical protein